jgi:hypothetical protein
MLTDPELRSKVDQTRETMGVREHLTAVLDNLSDDLVAEVRDFAEFLQQKHQQKPGSQGINSLANS